MAAGQALGPATNDHFLPADDAGVVRPGQVLGRGVGKARVHVGGDAAVPQEVQHALVEIAERPVQVTDLLRRKWGGGLKGSKCVIEGP